MPDEITVPVEVTLELDGKVVHPEEGDLIVIYHEDPDELAESLEAWASAIAFVQASVVVVEPGRDITVLKEKDMRELGWRRIKPRKKESQNG